MEGMGMNLKFVAATVASLGIIALSPASAYAAGGGCDRCYQGCADAFGTEDPVTGYQMLSLCVNSCTDDEGYLCGSAPTGG
jgi:hypothetical protein